MRLKRHEHQILEGLNALLRSSRFWAGNVMVKEEFGEDQCGDSRYDGFEGQRRTEWGDKAWDKSLELGLKKGVNKEQGIYKRERKEKARTWKQREYVDPGWWDEWQEKLTKGQKAKCLIGDMGHLWWQKNLNEMFNRSLGRSWGQREVFGSFQSVSHHVSVEDQHTLLWRVPGTRWHTEMSHSLRFWWGLRKHQEQRGLQERCPFYPYKHGVTCGEESGFTST